MTSDLISRIRLIRSPSIGPVTYRQLIQRFGSADAALQAIPDLARRGGGSPPRLASASDAERERAAVISQGIPTRASWGRTRNAPSPSRSRPRGPTRPRSSAGAGTKARSR